MANCNGNGTQSNCVECDIPQLARNHYFTGKLLVERDFTDEQRYFMGKERRHNRYLHGWGAVCGLKVKQHPNPGCQDEYVLIQPGLAVDCCGREILVAGEEYFDFKKKLLDNWQLQHGSNTQFDDGSHTVQICLRYRECASEEVPALFDDCGCTDGVCKPNRVLESYEFDTLLDPTPAAPDALGVKIAWNCTLNLAHAIRVAVSSATDTVYVLTTDTTGAAVYKTRAQNGAVLASQSFPAHDGVEIAVSHDGKFVYVVLGVSGGDPEILVLDATNLSTTISTLAVPGAGNQPVRLAVVPEPDGRLFAVNANAGALVWATDINTSATPAAPTTVAVGAGPVDIAIGADGKYAYVANHGSANIGAVKIQDLTVTNIAVPVAGGGSTPSAIAAASTTGGDQIAVLDTAAQKLYLIAMQPDPAHPADLPNSPATGFAYAPADVVLSLGGKWAYVLERDSTDKKGYVQAVDVHKVALKQSDYLGGAVPVGADPRSVALSADGRKLYVPYYGTDGGDTGAVAVSAVSQQDCQDILTQTIEGCPSCPDRNCIVLGTILNYKYGDLITDDRIDNTTDRRLLLSTSVITDVLECLMEQEAAGGIGPQGPPGAAGAGIDDIQATFVDCHQNGTAQIQTIGNKRTLVLKIPKGCDGDPGQAGLGIDQVTIDFVPCDVKGGAEIKMVGTQRTLVLTIPSSCNQDFTHIADINWVHAQEGSWSKIRKTGGLLVAFDGPVEASDIHPQSFAVLGPTLTSSGAGSERLARTCWCEIEGKVVAGNFARIGDVTSNFTPGPDANKHANGLQFAFDGLAWMKRPLRVVLQGDYIRDATTDSRGLDANHLPPWVPKRRSGDGIEGGTFESWFTLVD